MQALHKEDIKAKIRKQFGTMTEFEVRRGLAKGAAKNLLQGKPSARTAQAMAEVLEVPVEVIEASIKGAEVINDYKSTLVDSHRLNAVSK